MALDRHDLVRKGHRLTQLRAFREAVASVSLTRAAERLGVTQPAVSLHVRELEHELGAVLFERRGPRLKLTPAGERLDRIVRPLLQAVERLPESLANPGDGAAAPARLRLAATPCACAFVLPAALKSFRDAYPGVRMQVRRCAVERGLALLSDREVDLVVGAERPVARPLVYRPVVSYDLVLITALDHPLGGRASVTIEEAARYPAVVPPVGTFDVDGGEGLGARFLDGAHVVVEASDWVVIKRFVEEGFGVALVPSVYLHPDDRLARVAVEGQTRALSYGVFGRPDSVASSALPDDSSSRSITASPWQGELDRTGRARRDPGSARGSSGAREG